MTTEFRKFRVGRNALRPSIQFSSPASERSSKSARASCCNG
jgi:hypothetical protein